MIKPLRTQFVVADAGRARWVQRSDAADDFVTTASFEAEAAPASSPQGAVFEGSTGRAFNIEESHDAARQHHDRFAVDVAGRINAEAAADAFDRLALVAPTHFLSAIEHHLTPVAKAKLVKTLSKDLSKVPDHELGTWLRPLERG